MTSRYRLFRFTGKPFGVASNHSLSMTDAAVLDSVKAVGLASEVARLKARFVIKDADTSLKGAA
jgi:hypothetical protein